MTSPKKLIRSTFQFVVLHREDQLQGIKGQNLAAVLVACRNDELLGNYTLKSQETLLGVDEILTACRGFGDDGSFFLDQEELLEAILETVPDDSDEDDSDEDDSDEETSETSEEEASEPVSASS